MVPDKKYTPEQSLAVLYKSTRLMKLTADDHDALAEHARNVREGLKTVTPEKV